MEPSSNNANIDVIKQNAGACDSTIAVSSKPRVLTAAQRARIERNRQKALLLRQARVAEELLKEGSKVTAGCKRIIDTEGGFLQEEDTSIKKSKTKFIEEPAPVIAGDMTLCQDCDKTFLDSYLLSKFNHPCCDSCKDMDEKHVLITKTEARDLYLLSEVDITKREPLLNFIIKKNPRNKTWGDMKLYLQLQIEARALEVWGTPDALEEERKKRECKREVAKQKKYTKKMKLLRREVRSSLYTAKNTGHVHTYGAEVQVDDDTWSKSCLECDHRITFEKM